MIMCSRPFDQYKAHREEIDAAIRRVLDQGWYILGKENESFESEFSAYIGSSYGIGVGSGTEAIHIALSSCGVGPGDEVVAPSHTAVATVAAITLTGAKPVFVDIEPNFYTIDVERLEDAITAKTRAIIPVHLYGQAADMKSILALSKKHRIPVIEDCAQAHGAIYQGRPVGSWGDLSCFSFYPTKNLGALGDGGMILTSNPELAAKARLLREYGWEERYVSKIAGWNSRLDEMQAAILRVKLRYLDSDNGRRILLATKYDQALSGLRLITPKRRPAATHVYHLYVIRSSERDRLQAYLKERGVGALIHYPVPVHLQPAYRDLMQNTASLPVTEQVAREVLSLPIYPELSEHDLAKVVEIIHEYERGVFS